MLISHEVPISLLEESRSFNDYDYCLLHLTAIPEYKKYYQQAIKEGRKVLLDNSIFELGDALTLEEVYQGVMDIHPTWVIVPDCLDDTETTIGRFQEWEKRYPDLDVLTIGVVQGKSLEDLVRCYQYMSEHADKIAISFDSVAYDELSFEEDKLERWCNGRQLFIKYLVENNVWNEQKPHHLLGCSYAKEFSQPLYNELNIETIDTSNPIVAAIKYLKYKSYGLDEKPSVKLCDLIEYTLDEKQKELVKYNTQVFKKICGKNKWIAFFSQTGGEIVNLSKKLGRWPDLIVTNRQDLDGVVKELPRDLIRKIPEKPRIEDYRDALFGIDKKTALITLHGYLRVVPAEICDYNILNLHPGLITRYPELKGFNPQEKAYKLHLPVSGVVIHRVIPEVDSGEILVERPLNIKDKSLDEIYKELHDIATEAWMEVLEEKLC